MRQRLSRTIGAKVSAEECAAIEARASQEGKTTSSWVRTLLIEKLSLPAEHRDTSLILGEILALRTIVATLHFEASNRTLNANIIQEILNLADKDKAERAAVLLSRSFGGA